MGVGDNPIVYLARMVWKFSKGNRKQVILYFILFLFANILRFLDPLLVAWLLNTVQEQGINAQSAPLLITQSLLFIALNLGFWAFHGPARVIEIRNAFLVRVNYMKFLLDGVLSLPVEWHTNHHSGDTIDKVEKAGTALYDYARDTFLVIETIIRFVTSYFALMFFNLHASYIVVLVTILALTLIIRFDNFLRGQYVKLFSIHNTVSAKIFDVISNITTVVILRIEKLLSKEIFRKMMSPFKLFVRTTKVSETKWFFVSVFASVMTAAVLITYIVGVLNTGEVVLVGTVFALYRYVDRINDLFFRFAFKYGDIVRQKAAVENAQKISKHFKPKDMKEKVDMKHWEALCIEKLSFSYEDKEGELHLKDVSFAIKNGEKIALVGESGSGKTTFLKLMRGLYKPQHVEVYLDKQKLKHAFESVSDHITLIPQEPELFTTTIKNNITMGVSHSDEYVTKFTDMAQFTHVVQRLPKKFKSTIVEKGVNLSGGEKQRLALARGLLACVDKSILLLDEPTSSVDGKNELAIYKNIFKNFKEATLLSSVHRLHLLPLFDRVVMFERGRIVAVGPHKELLKKSAKFKKYWNKYHQVQK